MPVASPSVVLPLRAAMDPVTLVTLEDILIEAVRLRPSIYDKTAAVYKNNKVREQEWKEVAKAVDMQDVEAVKKRWRSLRDSFIKIQRSLRHNPRQIIKWLYYKRMTFLVPHIESKVLAPGGDASAKTFLDETTQEAQADSESESGGNRDDLRCSSDDVPPSDSNYHLKSDFKKSKSADEDSKDVDPLLPTIKDVDPQRRFLAGAMRKRKRKQMPKESAQLTSRHSDPDEQFLLSCLPALKRMTPRENAIARMRIQQVLFEAEFSNSQEQQQFLTKEEDIE